MRSIWCILGFHNWHDVDGEKLAIATGKKKPEQGALSLTDGLDHDGLDV